MPNPSFHLTADLPNPSALPLEFLRDLLAMGKEIEAEGLRRQESLPPAAPMPARKPRASVRKVAGGER